MNDLDIVPFRQLIDRVTEPARRHFRRLFLPVALPLAFAGLLLAILQGGWPTADIGSAADSALSFGFFFLLVAGFFTAYSLAFSALLVGSLDAVSGRGVDMRRAWLFPLRPRVLATLVIVAALDFLSAMMCLLPAFYVVPVLAFVLPVMVEEERFGFDAIRRSVELAHFNPTGRWNDRVFLQALVLLAIGLVINYAVTLAVQLPFVVIQQILIYREAAAGEIDPAELLAGSMWIQVPAQILTAFASAASWLYWTFGISLLYREVRRRREAGDLAQAIAELSGAAGEESAVVAPV